MPSLTVYIHVDPCFFLKQGNSNARTWSNQPFTASPTPPAPCTRTVCTARPTTTRSNFPSAPTRYLFSPP